MPTSAKEALEKVHSTELKDHELEWFNKLCLFTDYWIDLSFNGSDIKITFDNMFIPDPNTRNSNSKINCGPQCYHPKNGFPYWRQAVVVKVWIKTYEDLGWKITPIVDENYSYPQEYKFEIDKRDEKIKEILGEND